MCSRLINTIFVAPALIAACGPDSSPDGVVEGWKLARVALESGARVAFGAPDTSKEIKFLVGCFKEGYIQLDGIYSASTDGGWSRFSVAAVFHDCTGSDTLINGELQYELSSSVENGSADDVYTYRGTLEWSGGLNGSCSIDMIGTVPAGAPPAGAQYEGQICDYDASATLNLHLGGS